MSVLKYYDGSKWENVNGYVAGDTLPIGAIVPYGSSTAPTNWLVCDGSAVSRTTYAELFSAIGTSFGAGDGSTTFNLPNLKGRVAVGQDTSDSDFNDIGEKGGSKTDDLSNAYALVGRNTSNLNTISYKAKGGVSATFDRTLTGGGGIDGNNYACQDATTLGGSISRLQPYQVVCYIIKAKQSAGVVAQVETSVSNSNTNVYSCKYVNDTLSNLIKIKEVAGTTDGNGFLNLNMNLNQYIVLGVRVKIGQDSFANPYNMRGIGDWSVQLKTWDGQNIGSTQFTLEVVYIET